jgi:spore germination protein KA
MFNFIKSRESKNTKQLNAKQPIQNDKNSSNKIPKSIEKVKGLLNQEFSLCSDFNLREIVLGKLGTRIIIPSIGGFFDKAILAENIIKPIVNYSGNSSSSVLALLKDSVLCISDLKELKTMKESIDVILSGDVVIFIDGEEEALKIGLKSPEKRAVGEPDTEISLKGSREGFSESLRTNTILLRKRIKNAKFKVESIVLGKQTNTDIEICYIQGIAAPELVNEVKNRLGRINIDSILATGYIEQFIQDGKFPFFPMVGNSEKPDKVAAKLLEGRVAVLSDGTPTVLTVPFLMIESFQAQEDYFGEFYFASFMRILRLISFFISVYLPGLYVALTSFHQTIIPFKLMLTMAATREGIPFSSFIEALIMVLTFEILREAGLRMPRAIGQAVSIVGAIVLGDAAVSAGIASAPLVIIAALAGICSFIVPPLMKVGAILRMLMLIAATILGLMGIGFVTFILTIYLCGKKSFFVPYLAPFAPFREEGLKDSFVVTPIWTMFNRPRSLTLGQNRKRTTGKSFSTGRKTNE